MKFTGISTGDSFKMDNLGAVLSFLSQIKGRKFTITFDVEDGQVEKWVKPKGFRRGGGPLTKDVTQYPWPGMKINQTIEFAPEEYEAARVNAMWYQRKNPPFRVTTSASSHTIRRTA